MPQHTAIIDQQPCGIFILFIDILNEWPHNDWILGCHHLFSVKTFIGDPIKMGSNFATVVLPVLWCASEKIVLLPVFSAAGILSLFWQFDNSETFPSHFVRLGSPSLPHAASASQSMSLCCCQPRHTDLKLFSSIQQCKKCLRGLAPITAYSFCVKDICSSLSTWCYIWLISWITSMIEPSFNFI